MGLLDFLKGKKTPEAPAVKIEVKPTFPEAIALAEKHDRERAAVNEWLMSGSDPLKEPEDPSVTRHRHDAELAEGVSRRRGLEGVLFKTAYHEALSPLIQARTAALEAYVAVANPKAAGEQQLADEYSAAIDEGKAVPEWVHEAHAQGFSNGVAVSATDAAEQERLSAEHLQARAEWEKTLPEEDRSVALWLYFAGFSKGLSAGSAQAIEVAPEQPVAVSSVSNPLPSTVQSVLSDSSFWDHQVSSITFLAGDLGKGTGYLLASGKIRIPGGAKDFPMHAVSRVEIASEESVKRVGGALGWGLAGAALFGGAGLIVGGLLGGKGVDVTFVGTLSDGSRFLATARKDIYVKFQAAAF